MTDRGGDGDGGAREASDGDEASGSAFDDVTRRLVQRLPYGVKRLLAVPYNHVQRVRADRAFARRAREFQSLTPGADAPRHVVCVVVDALRADVVDAETTPFLADRRVASAVTPSPWTFPAVTSLATGRYPHEHGSMRQSDDVDRGATDLVIPPTLPDHERTLPEVFAAAGYDTYGGFAFHMPFFALGGRFATNRVYDDAPADDVLGDFLDWFDGRRDGRTFSYVHLGDLHEPVDPPAPYWDRYDVDDSIEGIRRWRFREEAHPGHEGERYRDHRRRLYRAAATHVDDRLAVLRERLPDDVALLVTGDHGEALWEQTSLDRRTFHDSRPAYGIDHGGTPFEAIARVPLAMEGVDVRSGGGTPSLVDVAPTLLDALGQMEALATTGCSLSRGVPGDRVPLVEAARYGHEKKAAYRDGWKLVVSRGDDAAVGFDLPDDPGTTAREADLPADVEAALYDALPPWPDGSDPERRVSGMAQQRLEDLGYV
ncbi:sulfatase-like hydrolase/transferase [Halobaculum marinum]|uniref:Sulfatase-like hydrolase/transferase n=1 Tax=Halobaculum marinum TaxID=3031996 RepID=A0ABD5X3G8_9EURY|nr:sulfatase-like hydrolase/transferase [Halobaculum sp. DT55]